MAEETATSDMHQALGHKRRVGPGQGTALWILSIVQYNVGCAELRDDGSFIALMPSAITVGPDGALWFTDSKFNYLGRITTTGEIAYHPYAKPQAGCGQASSIVAGPDGNLWFTCSDPNIYRFTP